MTRRKGQERKENNELKRAPIEREYRRLNDLNDY